MELLGWVLSFVIMGIAALVFMLFLKMKINDLNEKKNTNPVNQELKTEK